MKMTGNYKGAPQCHYCQIFNNLKHKEKKTTKKTASVLLVITALLLEKLNTGLQAKTATAQKLSVPKAISGGYRQEEAVICQHTRQQRLENEAAAVSALS